MSEVLTKEQREELLVLLDTHGGKISPKVVLEFARNPQTHLHKYCLFGQPDAELAELYRLERARLAICQLQLRKDEAKQVLEALPRQEQVRLQLKEQARHLEEKGVRRIFSFHGERGKSKESYVDVLDILKSQDLRDKMRQDLIRELETYIETRAVHDLELYTFLARTLLVVKQRFGLVPEVEAGD